MHSCIISTVLNYYIALSFTDQHIPHNDIFMVLLVSSEHLWVTFTDLQMLLAKSSLSIAITFMLGVSP